MTQTSLNSNRWFVCPRPNVRADTRLFLFPYAGGAPSAFHAWANEFPSNIETHIIHYPGRGSRYNEPLLNSINTLVEKIYDAIQPLLDRPFFFMGHSMGGIVAFELTRLLQQHDLPFPKIFFVSACGAPHIPDPHAPIHKLLDPEFTRSIQQLNGIPSEALSHAELMQLLLPVLRADFEAIENYQHLPDDFRLGHPVIALGGLADPRVSRERLESWSAHTHDFKLQYFPGDHFFINTARQSVITFVVDEMKNSNANK